MKATVARAEKQFAAILKRPNPAQTEQESAQQIANLRALRLAKEGAGRERTRTATATADFQTGRPTIGLNRNKKK